MSDMFGRCVVILAAGGSTRMGESKLTMPFVGSSLLEHALDAACACEADHVVVVTGAHREKVCAILESYPHVAEIHNHEWESGQATSITQAVSVLKEEGWSAALLMLADQPYVDAVHLNELLSAFDQGGTDYCAFVSRVGSRDGNPCLFPRRSFDALLALRGDQGARKLYRSWPAERVRFVYFEEPRLFHDVDTPEDARVIERRSFYGHDAYRDRERKGCGILRAMER